MSIDEQQFDFETTTQADTFKIAGHCEDTKEAGYSYVAWQFA